MHPKWRISFASVTGNHKEIKCENPLIAEERFGKLSGLEVIWEKMVTFLIGSPCTMQFISDSQLTKAEYFKFLGIQIHNDISKFILFNLDPLVSQMKSVLPICNSSPLI